MNNNVPTSSSSSSSLAGTQDTMDTTTATTATSNSSAGGGFTSSSSDRMTTTTTATTTTTTLTSSVTSTSSIPFQPTMVRVPSPSRAQQEQTAVEIGTWSEISGKDASKQCLVSRRYGDFTEADGNGGNSLANIISYFRRACESQEFAQKCDDLGLREGSFQANAWLNNNHPSYHKFLEALPSLHEDDIIAIGFHGTAEANIETIARQGLDPAKRTVQAYGPGEYFAKNPQISVGYCKRGVEMLVFLLVIPRGAQAEVERSPENYNNYTDIFAATSLGSGGAPITTTLLPTPTIPPPVLDMPTTTTTSTTTTSATSGTTTTTTTAAPSGGGGAPAVPPASPPPPLVDNTTATTTTTTTNPPPPSATATAGGSGSGAGGGSFFDPPALVNRTPIYNHTATTSAPVPTTATATTGGIDNDPTTSATTTTTTTTPNFNNNTTASNVASSTLLASGTGTNTTIGGGGTGGGGNNNNNNTTSTTTTATTATPTATPTCTGTVNNNTATTMNSTNPTVIPSAGAAAAGTAAAASAPAPAAAGAAAGTANTLPTLQQQQQYHRHYQHRRRHRNRINNQNNNGQHPRTHSVPYNYIVVENNNHQLPIGTMTFESVDNNVMMRAQQLRTKLLSLTKRAEMEQNRLEETSIKSSIMQNLMNNHLEAASQQYIANLGHLSEIARKEIAWYVRPLLMSNNTKNAEAESKRLETFFPNLPPPIQASEMATADIQPLEVAAKLESKARKDLERTQKLLAKKQQEQNDKIRAQQEEYDKYVNNKQSNDSEGAAQQKPAPTLTESQIKEQEQLQQQQQRATLQSILHNLASGRLDVAAEQYNTKAKGGSNLDEFAKKEIALCIQRKRNDTNEELDPELVECLFPGLPTVMVDGNSKEPAALPTITKGGGGGHDDDHEVKSVSMRDACRDDDCDDNESVQITYDEDDDIDEDESIVYESDYDMDEDDDDDDAESMDHSQRS